MTLATSITALENAFAPIQNVAEKLTIPFPAPLVNAVDDLSSMLGFPDDQLRYVIGLLACYPLAVIFTAIPGRSLKHVFSFVCGMLVLQFVMGAAWIHSFITSTITYALINFSPAKYAPYIVIVFNLGYLSCAHLYRVYVDYMGWTLDFTGPQMILTIKLTSLAFNYYDGVIDKKRINSNPENKGLAKVYASRRTYAVDKMPSILEFYGYCYTFSTIFAGPAFELREYLESVNGTKFAKIDEKEKKSNAVGSPPASRYLQAIKKLILGAACMGLYITFIPKYHIPAIYSAETLAKPFLQRVAFAWFTLLICRMKYYFAWKVGEGSAVLSSFGFEGFTKDGHAKGWNGVSNIDIVTFETAQSVRDGSRAWNKGTQAWLERYIYSRTGNSLAATYFCSAFWHGFYPGYYIFFMSVPLATAVNRKLYKRVRPYFLNADGSEGSLKVVYDTVGRINTSLTMNYLVLPFQVLAWEYSAIVLSSFYFIGHIILGALYVATSLVPVRRFAGAAKAKDL